MSGPSNIPVTSRLVRQNSANFGVADVNDVAGAPHIYSDSVLRDAAVINSPLLFKIGQTAYTQNDQKTWQLVTITPLVWKEEPVSAVTEYPGIGDFPPASSVPGQFSWATGTNQLYVSAEGSWNVVGVASNLATVISWVNPTPWADIYSQIVLAGGIARVLLSDSAGYVIPAGSYNLSGVSFDGVGADENGTQLEFASGCHIDAGPVVGLNLFGVTSFCSSPLMIVDAPKQVRVNLRDGSTLIGLSAQPTFSMFRPGGSLGTIHFFDIEDSQMRNNSGDCIFVNDSTSFLWVQAFGGKTSLDTDFSFSGVAGVLAILFGDGFTQTELFRPNLLTPPVAVAFGQTANFGFPLQTTAGLPAPTLAHLGQAFFDIDAGVPKVCNGSAWVQLPAKIVSAVLTEIGGAGPVVFAGAAVGMRVVGVLNLSTGGTPAFFDASSNFEPTITVAGQIQQLGAGSGTGIVYVTLST